MRPDSAPLALSSVPKTAVRRKAGLASVLRVIPHAPFLMILPSFILTAVIIGYPLLVLIWTSFHRVSHFGIVLSLNGIENYVSVLSDPLFLSSLWRTVIWTVAVTGGTVLASVPLALMLNDDFLGRDLARAIVLMPWSVSLTMTAVVWRWALNGRAGLFNATLMDFGILHQPIEWLGTASRAFPIEILIGIAVSIPFSTIVLLGGLSSVAPSLYEAARIDGASSWQLLRHITLPLMRPFLNIAVVLNVIYVFNSFPIIWVMTEGGPANGTDILVTYLYKLAFRFGQLGKASVISLMMFIILLAVTTLYVVLQSRKAEPEAGGTA
jgi:multiple sugar transport system permease protein